MSHPANYQHWEVLVYLLPNVGKIKSHQSTVIINDSSLHTFALRTFALHSLNPPIHPQSRKILKTMSRINFVFLRLISGYTGI